MSRLSSFSYCGLFLVVLVTTLGAEPVEPTRPELLQRIKLLEEQNAKLAVDASRAKMEADEYRKKYQTVAVVPEVSAEELAQVKAKLWKAEVSLGATASSGNNDAYQVNLAAKGTRTTEIDELILALSADIGENEGIRTSEKGKASADYRRDFDERWYWLVISSLERDQLSDLDYRLTGGPGIGYKLWDTDKFKWALESGPAFVAEKNSNNNVDYSVRGRVADRLEYQFTKSVKLFQTSEVLFNFQDSDDYLVNNELGVESSLNKALSLRVFGKHRYDNQPAVDKKENDFSLISAIVYKFE